jgi:uncharacterized protein YjbI with pentapeptide repeats
LLAQTRFKELMRIVTDSSVKLSWTVGQIKDLGLILSVAVKAGFQIKDDGSLARLPEPPDGSGDVFSDGEEGRTELVYPSDFVPFKPRADILLVGTAHAPDGRPTPWVEVRARVGGFEKILRLTGDRFWQRRFLFFSRASTPKEFKSMPIIFARAYGGKKFRKNPAGIGRDRRRLPNIESPEFLVRRRGDRPLPVAFGPISADWEPRRSKTGTYKGNWLKERWPWFPDDFDWSYYNSAPADQQIDGYLRGDEELEFCNMHPTHPVYRSRLPGLRARAFIEVEVPDAPPEFGEVKLNLDTTWIDTEGGKVVLVWRGLTRVRNLKLKEVLHLAALTEPLTSPVRSLSEMREWMRHQVQVDRGEVPATPEQAAAEAASKAAWAAFDQKMAAMDQEKAELEKELAVVEKDLDKEIEQQKADLLAQGVDPKLFDPPPVPTNDAGGKAQLADLLKLLAPTHPEEAAQLATLQTDLDELAKIEQEVDSLASKGLAPSRETVSAAVAQGKGMPNADLAGLDFSNLDFSGTDFSGADFSRANLSGAKFIASQLKGVSFKSANLTGTDFSKAVLDEADFGESLVLGARFTGASIQGVTFGGLQMAGIDFSGCKGKFPDFSKGNLEGANFAGAKLPQADFCRANVKAANFAQAELASADFGGALAIGINLEQADLTNLRAGEKSDFTGGRFRAAKAPKSIWAGAVLVRADFSRAELTGALFEDAMLREARFDSADLTKASFEDASVQRALLANANLLRATFNRANLTGAILDGSNLYEASFWETVLKDTSRFGANVKGTSLA